MDKKTLIGIALIAVIIMGWPKIIKIISPNLHKQIYQKKKIAQIKKPGKIQQPNDLQMGLPQTTPAQTSITSMPTMPTTQAFEEKFYTIKTKELELEISNKGASIRSINLPTYNEKLLDKTTNYNGIFNITNPINITQSEFKIQSQTPVSIILSTNLNKDLTITKEYRLTSDYLLEYNITFQNSGTNKVPFIEGYKLNVSSGLGLPENLAKQTRDIFNSISILKNETDKKAELYKKNKKEIIYQDAYWLAQQNKYFALILKPNTMLNSISIDPLGDKPYPELTLRKKGFMLQPGQTITDKYTAYIGPKSMPILKAYNLHLEKIINLGFFSPIGKVLLWLLHFFYGWIHNYGIAIILVTISMKIVLHPLTNKSFKSMKEMQKINPLLQKLRETHKGNPQKLQKETMMLYKKHKVNPLGGCMPMILQMPLFFALFTVLQNAIELRGAPFMLWVTDLSAKDPYYVLPILMGATMLLQQKMSPTAMDPKQEKMMLIMPIFFTFIFLKFPSGLVIYWLMNNVLTIIHQLMLKRTPKTAQLVS